MIKPEEITWALKKEIEAFSPSLAMEEVGHVLKIGDGVAQVYGLDKVMLGELLEFSNQTIGIALNLEHKSVGVVLLGPEEGIEEKGLVKRTGKISSVPVGEGLLGRVVNPLGEPLDGKGPIQSTERRPVEWTAPSVLERTPVHQPLETGIKAIDAMIPVGLGQRELIIGDRQTGKTTLILDTILNQRGKGTYCFYVSIGQKASTLSRIIALLEKEGAMAYTTVIAATASDPAPLQYIAPYAGTAMGEYFMYSGRHAICGYDDLSKHAQAWRQLSLLLKRPPGREAYPGDIFYQHSRLLERAAKLNEKKGGGSLTALPVIETQAGDVTTYIPTNVISITDGQIYLEAELFHAKILPAINVGISASRVGGKAQTRAMKKVAGTLRLDLAQYRELATFTQFGSELDEKTAALLQRGEKMVEILKQKKSAPFSLAQEVIILFAGTRGFLDDIPLDKISSFEEGLYPFMKDKFPDVAETINKSQDLSEKTEERLRMAILEYKKL